jgi:DNA-binding NarL/FixJ family response regulator
MSDSRPAHGPRLKLLLVEDSRQMQDVLTQSVHAVPGLELVGVVATAADAMAAFKSHHPDVVILDLVLRAGSGLDVLRSIKQHTPACRVLVFSGHDEEPFPSRCVAAGADHFFSKARQHQELIQELNKFTGDLTAAPAEPERGSLTRPFI